MDERSSVSWRALIAAGVFVGLIVAAMLIVGRGGKVQEEPVAPPAPEQDAIVAAAPAPLSRAELIDAAARAADAYARGVPAPPTHLELIGRRFSFQIPFGCAGPAPEKSEAPAQWNYDAEEGTLRASFSPQVWRQAELLRAVSPAAEFEAAEGFWIPRPWLRSGECPRQPQPPAALSPAAEVAPATSGEEPAERPGAASPPSPVPLRQTLAVVELYAPGSRRAARRGGKAYEVVAKVAPSEIDLNRGLRLVVEGRVAALAGDQPIACQSSSVDEMPLCMIGAQTDRIAITDASGQRVLAEWTD